MQAFWLVLVSLLRSQSNRALVVRRVMLTERTLSMGWKELRVGYLPAESATERERRGTTGMATK